MSIHPRLFSCEELAGENYQRDFVKSLPNRPMERCVSHRQCNCRLHLTSKVLQHDCETREVEPRGCGPGVISGMIYDGMSGRIILSNFPLCQSYFQVQFIFANYLRLIAI